MATNAQDIPQASVPPKRRVKNYLLDSRFQLKYTSMVVGVTVVVAGVLGSVAFKYSHDQTEAMNIQMVSNPSFDPEMIADVRAMAEAEDRKVLLGIIGGICVMALSLGVTGIIVTHRLVGPAYKIKVLLGEVARGHLKIEQKLRKGDELQDVFEAFEQMVVAIRERQDAEIALLSRAIDRARGVGVEEDVIRELEALRSRMQKELATSSEFPPRT